MLSVYLASGSPRRQELLTQLGLSFERLSAPVEERRHPGKPRWTMPVGCHRKKP